MFGMRWVAQGGWKKNRKIRLENNVLVLPDVKPHVSGPTSKPLGRVTAPPVTAGASCDAAVLEPVLSVSVSVAGGSLR